MWASRALLRRSGPALACLSVAALDQKRREVAEACGIVGVVGRENDDARGFLLEGLMVSYAPTLCRRARAALAAVGGKRA